MEQYIKKSVLVADIKERIKTYNKGYANGDDSRADALEVLLHDIDTIETKEVDLERLINDYFTGWYFDSELDILAKPNNYSATVDDVKEIAKHFFELGLKARKGEIWKVVDNVNHPQADRNKIYCVFTKQQYILATVINHPQDEDLLQWKCTEFPFHRYDMCEGDKYMQIV